MTPAVAPVASWCGVIVRDLDAAAAWYERALGCKPADEGLGWATLVFGDGSGFELLLGDPDRPGLSFPSYGTDPGPPLMPGFALEDADDVAAGLTVARRLPGWTVVVSPDGLRMVLATGEFDRAQGLVAFRFASPRPEEQRAFVDDLNLPVIVEPARRRGVVPVVLGDADGERSDPEGNIVRVVTAAPGA